MRSMFGEAPRFNQPLDTWDVSNVCNMNYMVNGATSFNQTLHAWRVSPDANRVGMFVSARDRPSIREMA